MASGSLPGFTVTPFVGVWIETGNIPGHPELNGVTPFVGVWIETANSSTFARQQKVTPFVGVWIETLHLGFKKKKAGSHPSWVCGLKHVILYLYGVGHESHPSWVCGLKRLICPPRDAADRHTLRGCVD